MLLPSCEVGMQLLLVEFTWQACIPVRTSYCLFALWAPDLSFLVVFACSVRKLREDREHAELG